MRAAERNERPARAGTGGRGPILAILCAADFLGVLDGLVVAVALPAIQRDLGLSTASLQWVVTAYVLCFGGFLLLGGRLGDLYGRRRVLVLGLLLFAAGAMLAGVAWAAAVLYAGRAIQGLGAALMTPTALAMLTAAYPATEERQRALGLWSAAGSIGIPAGALLGGVLTAMAGWRWVLLVNVPAALIAAAATRRWLPTGRAGGHRRGLDAPGAVLVTGGLGATVLGITGLEHARTATDVLGRVGVPALLGAVLLLAFARRELRARDPLVPPAALRGPGRISANLAGSALPVGLGAVLFLATLYLQRVLGYAPLQTGLAYLALALPIVVAGPLADRVVALAGRRATALVGVGLQVAALLLLARSPAEGTFLADVLPGFVLVGVGAPLAFVPLTAAAMSGADDDAGLVSGIFNTAQQLGNAFALAAVATLTAAFGRPGAASGYTAGFVAAALLVALSAIPVLLLSGPGRGAPGSRPVPEWSRHPAESAAEQAPH